MNDTTAIIASVVAVVAAVAWEPILRVAKSAMAAKPVAVLPVPPVVVPVVAPGAKVPFSGAIDALAVVRNRLVETGCMSEAATAAVEAITHALVAGTDK